MPTVPLFSAQAMHAHLDLGASIRRVLDSQRFVLDQEVRAFEREFAEYCGVEHAVAVANGTDALELALRGLGLGSGDRVALVANAGYYGSAALHLVGAEATYIDVDPVTLTMSAEGLRVALQKVPAERPKAVLVTHLYGRLADMAALAALADEAQVPLIEDCAQAHGAQRSGRRAGAFGALGCFSFYPTKNLGALGDGGALVTSDAALAERLRALRQYGWGEKYHVQRAGGRNSRLDELQAAVLRDKLPLLDDWNAERRAIARRYNEAFAGLPLICPPPVDESHVAHLYVVRSNDRQALRASLRAAGIASDVHYPVADHRQPIRESSDPSAELPVTEEACATVLSLPCFPGLDLEDQERVIAAVRSHFAGSVSSRKPEPAAAPR